MIRRPSRANGIVNIEKICAVIHGNLQTASQPSVVDATPVARPGPKMSIIFRFVGLSARAQIDSPTEHCQKIAITKIKEPKSETFSGIPIRTKAITKNKIANISLD